MANVHYKHLEKTIKEFFAKKGMKVVIEPHGSYGADLEGAEGLVLTLSGERRPPAVHLENSCSFPK